jgi:hypothetical protein
VGRIEGGDWQSDRDWKTIFGTEVGSGVGRGLGLPQTLPLFEMTCRLLYREQPSELTHFVTFAQLARDCQAQEDSAFARRCRKTYFFLRAVQCLPQFVSPEATPTSPEALLAHSHLILHRYCLYSDLDPCRVVCVLYAVGAEAVRVLLWDCCSGEGCGRLPCPLWSEKQYAIPPHTVPSSTPYSPPWHRKEYYTAI